MRLYVTDRKGGNSRKGDKHNAQEMRLCTRHGAVMQICMLLQQNSSYS